MTDVSESQREQWEQLEFSRMKKERKVDRILWIVLVVMTVIVFCSAVVSVIMYFVSDKENSLETTLNQLIMSVLALLCFGIPVIFKRKFKVHIPSFLLIIIYLFIFAHFIMGEIYRVYDKSIIFDKVLHTTGGFVIAFIGVSVVFSLSNMKNEKVKLSPFFVALFSFCFALALEYVWELFEYAVDRVAGANMQRWQDAVVMVDGQVYYDENGYALTSIPYGSGLKDSMGDMFVNIIGALVVSVITFFVLSYHPQWLLSRLIVSEKKMRQIAKLHVEEQIAGDVPVPDFSALTAPKGKAAKKDRLGSSRKKE